MLMLKRAIVTISPQTKVLKQLSLPHYFDKAFRPPRGGPPTSLRGLVGDVDRLVVHHRLIPS